MKSKVLLWSQLGIVLALVLFLGTQISVFSQPPGNNSGRLSPASFDIDLCGCPSWFDQPVCEERTSWTIEKMTEAGQFVSPDNEPFSFTITVTEGPTRDILSGNGSLIIANSGEVTSYLSSIAVNLEQVWSGPSGQNPSPAPGPSGKNWLLLATAIQNESAACENLGVARTCYGELQQTSSAFLVLYDPDTNDVIALTSELVIPPTLDNDGDGLRDEDPPLPADPDLITGGCAVIDNDSDGLYDEDPIDGIDNDGDGLIDEDDPDDDGDGLVDEDGTCEDAVTINFEYEFDITDLGIEGPGDGIVPSDDDLRIDLVATFDTGNKRGSTCSADVDCDDVDDEWIRSIQQRLRFDPVECTPVCDAVTLTDDGAWADHPECVDVTTTVLNEEIAATGVEGTEHNYYLTGTVSCISSFCFSYIQNEATLTCEDPDLIEGSPATATFLVLCENIPPPIVPGDFCTETQGGWGQDKCGGNNVGCLRNQYFDDVFPEGLVIGDPAGPDADGSYAILLSSSVAVAAYLPAGGPASALTADQTDPLMTSSGVFGGQLVAATLNVAFDAAGYGLCTLIENCDFPNPPGTLGTLVYVGCVDDDLIGHSVNEVIAWANTAISGGGTPDGVSISDLNQALDVLNQEFDDCDTYSGCLALP